MNDINVCCLHFLWLEFRVRLILPRKAQNRDAGQIHGIFATVSNRRHRHRTTE